MPTQNKFHFTIFNAPSLFHAFTSLGFGGTGERIPVIIRFRDGGSSMAINVIIHSLAREDGSGNRWLFKGYFVDLKMSISPGGASLSVDLADFLNHLRTVSKEVHGYFDTQTRDGWIEDGFPQY